MSPVDLDLPALSSNELFSMNESEIRDIQDILRKIRVVRGKLGCIIEGLERTGAEQPPLRQLQHHTDTIADEVDELLQLFKDDPAED